MNFQDLPIDQKINLRMSELILHHTLTKHPTLRKLLPRNCKTKAFYNTCYDYGRLYVSADFVNKNVLSKISDRVREFIQKGLPKNKYLKIELVAGSRPPQFKHSFTNELPRNYKDLERTSFVKFMKSEEVDV